jgi:hypothetical protein
MSDPKVAFLVWVGRKLKSVRPMVWRDAFRLTRFAAVITVMFTAWLIRFVSEDAEPGTVVSFGWNEFSYTKRSGTPSLPPEHPSISEQPA